MRRCGWALVLLAALAPASSSQEPPATQGGEGGQEEKQEEKKEETRKEERQDPAPAPEHRDSAQEPNAPPPAETSSAGAAPPESVLRASSEPPRPGHPAVVWPLAIDAIASHLHAIAEAHPAVAALEVMGRSASGLEILALRLGSREDAPSAERPVLLLLDSQGASSAGPEAMLELAWALAEEFEYDERVRALLMRTTLVIAPALDPDARAKVTVERASDAGHPALCFERNFPSGWQPESVRPGSGRVPLSQPETLTAARFLANLKGCAVVLGFTAPAPRGAP